jgi:hypothetical protein
MRTMAFTCSDSDDEDQNVVFAVSQAAARAEYGQRDCLTSMKVFRSPAFDEFAPGPVPVSALLEQGWYSHCSNHDCGRRISYDEGRWAEPGRDPAIVEEAVQEAVRQRDEAKWLEANPEPEMADGEAPWGEKSRTRREHEDWERRRRHELKPKEPPMLDRAALRFIGGEVYCSLTCQQSIALTIAKADLLHMDAEAEARRRWPGAPEYESSRWPQIEPRVRFRPPSFSQDVHWHADEDQAYVMPEDVPLWNAMIEKTKNEETTT